MSGVGALAKQKDSEIDALKKQLDEQKALLEQFRKEKERTQTQKKKKQPGKLKLLFVE